MKKVAQINSVCGFGSTGRTTKDLAVIIEKNGLESKVFYGMRSTDYHNAEKFTNDFEIKTHVLKTRLLGKHSFYSKQATKRLVRMLKEYKPDIIRLGQVHGHYLNVPVLFDYFEKSHVPVIWTLHDCWAMTGHCSHFANIECEKWKTGCYNCPQLREYPISLVFDRSKESWRDKKKYFSKPKNMTIVAPSKWVEMRARESFLSKYDILTIYNGVDIDIFKPRETAHLRKSLGMKQDDFVVLGMAGKWFNAKNVSKSLEFTKLAEKMKIVIVGAKNQHEKYLSDNMIKLSYISDIEKLAEVYSMADVFLNMSYEDSFSKVTAEALASGTPVVGFDATAIPEVIGDCGRVIDISSSGEEIYREVQDLKNTDLSALSKKAVKRVKENFDDKKNYMKYVELIKKKIL